MENFGRALEEAREARGLSTSDLAQELGVRRETVYRWERGDAEPSHDMRVTLMEVLDVPSKFFDMPPPNESLSPIFMRSLTSVRKAAEVKTAERRLTWLREIVSSLERLVEFPAVDLGRYQGPSDPLDISAELIELVASDLRRTWGLGDGAITQMPALLDNAGIVAARNHLGIRAIAAFSQPGFKDARPVIILANDGATAAHTQADCAHELGHLILHANVDKRHLQDREKYRLIENQAWRFARAFLLPAESFRESVRSVTLDYFAQLKLSWCVSIALMIKRAADVGIADETLAKSLWINRQNRRWTKVEPYDEVIRVDRPQLLRQAAQEVINAGSALVQKWLAMVRLGASDVARYTEISEQDLLRSLETGAHPPRLRIIEGAA